MNSIINFITGKKTAWVTLLLGLIFAVLAFGPLAATTSETAPTNGLSETSETALVSKAMAALPGNDATVAVIVYAVEATFSDEDILWLQGSFDPQSQQLVGGANEKFLEYTNLEVMGSKFVPPALISDDNTTAVITVPLQKIRFD